MTRSKQTARRATVLLCVLVCMLVSSALATASLRSALCERRGLQLLDQMRQTQLLLDAGVMRAARRLSESQEYKGERWGLADSGTRFTNAAVEIQIDASAQARTSQVKVVATIGAPGLNRSTTQRSHTFTFTHSKPPAPEIP